jgi:formylglycine-generating enzyme required for sulfatase activity
MSWTSTLVFVFVVRFPGLNSPLVQNMQAQTPRLTITKQQGQNQYYEEALSDAVKFCMMLIPSGKFLMGSPKDEPERLDREGPQHEVTISQFFMAEYPVTQAQWKIVAAMPQVERELKTDPSRFKGDNNPVENVSWDDAAEFCKRLTIHTNREYRLPSEAEWEYACRAGTTTPFHFGETITTDLANYRGTDWKLGETTYPGFYGDGPRGEFLEKTTPVDHFGLANAFGLSDMHGNVWEWCADHWHDNYEGAPSDGSAWLNEDKEEKYILRGGSWFNYPGYCRAACRNRVAPDVRDNGIGFRVCCSLPRTQ